MPAHGGRVRYLLGTYNVNIVHLFLKYPSRDSGTAVISRSTFTKTFDRTNNVQSPDPPGNLTSRSGQSLFDNLKTSGLYFKIN